MSLATTPQKASGTTLSYADLGASPTFTSLALLIDLEMGGISAAKIETGGLFSTWKTSIPSIPDGGDVTFSVYFVQGDAGLVAVQGMIIGGQTKVWQIQVPDGSSPTTGSKVAFDGWVANYAPKGFAVDGTPVADVTITVTGPITFTPGT